MKWQWWMNVAVVEWKGVEGTERSRGPLIRRRARATQEAELCLLSFVALVPTVIEHTILMLSLFEIFDVPTHHILRRIKESIFREFDRRENEQ